ncbi:MAG: ATP-binding protein [Bacteroidales bacterium]|nr:ATP-binding protein [Bacteroidales bacterium]
MIQRTAEKRLKKLYDLFKVVAVTGPRQSGKTTLVKHVFPHKPYLSLENPETRQFAMDDPRGFLSQFPDGAILDEVQRTPQLFSYLQEIVDAKKDSGQFILTGSNNFLLNENISQSLAGRVAFLYLLPFSYEELKNESFKEKESQPDENSYILKGFYPPIYDMNIPSNEWLPAYIRTYIERDVRQIKNITNLLVFERFMRLLAGRTGQELNYTSLSVEAGVDVKTIQSWIGILESSYIIFLLKPFYKNYNKTIVKRPKLYFYDTGIACSLLGITQLSHLENHPLRGALFETMVLSEIVKMKFNTGSEAKLFYWRDKTGREIDLLIDTLTTVMPVEVKVGRTFQKEFLKNIRYWMKLTGEKQAKLIYSGDDEQKRSDGIHVVSWKHLSGIFGG